MNEAQEVELNIYRDVANLCRRHGIRYYAMGGTLLGAIRHKGFIPWDDDVDIAIPRPDYRRFLEYARTELPSKYLPVTYEGKSKDEMPVYLCQILDTTTEVMLNMTNNGKHSCLWLDVFPLDAMPTNKILRLIQKYRLLYMRMKVQSSNFDNAVHQHRANRPLKERALIKFCKLTKFAQNCETSDLLRQTEEIACRYDYEQEDYLVNLWGVYKFREMFPKAWFGDGIELPFEDTTMICPVEYDKVLTQMYGDYMTPPPQDERNLQHCMTVISTGGDKASHEEGDAK